MIRQGRVSVDGKVVSAMGSQVRPEVQEICLDGKPVLMKENKITLLLNKPSGYVTTLSDPQGRPIVTSLLRGISTRLFPVGRLDLDTEGALILTNDGDLAERIQHPRFEVKKTYEALVRGCPTAGDLKLLEQGIMLEGRKTSPATAAIIKREGNTSLVRITIHEGRKRQVKKMFSAVGKPVTQLKRIAYGHLLLKNLPVGSFRILSSGDIKKIFL
jgi:pseudouridine synthase